MTREPVPIELRALNEFEASAITGLSVQTLRNRRWSNRPPAYCKAGKKVVYRYSDLLAFLDRIEPER